LRFKKINIINIIVFNKKIIVLILSMVSLILNCQEVKLSERISEIAEELAAEESDPGSAEFFSEMLFDLAEDPVKINTGNEKEISRLFFLTDFQVKVLSDYIRTSGMILSQFEIANIPGFDKELVEMLDPFITLERSITTPIDSSRLRQTLLTNFIIKSTANDTSVLGSPWKVLTKYKLIYRRITTGFTTEKDPGENYIYGKPPLPDFLSGYLSYNGKGVINRIVIGDFSARFGQGTNINTLMRSGLSLTSPGYMAGRSEIRPYTSTDENNFFRGAAAELSYETVDLDLFVSRHRIDATVNEITDSSFQTIKSFYTSGIHNTFSSILKKDAVSETNYGIHLSYNLKNLRTGLILSETRLSSPVMTDRSDPADRNDFAGKQNNLYTIYYNGNIKRAVLFGEFSISGMKNYAVVQGVSFKPAGRLSINLLYRNYSPGFISFHGKGPSGSSVSSNEYGILGNFTFEAARFLFISAGTDLRYYPWLRYRCSSPSMAKRDEIRIKYLPSKRLAFDALYNHRSSVADSNEENCIPGQQETITRSIKGSVRFSPSEYLTLITRVDYKTVDPTDSRGMLLLQDINLKCKRLPLSIWMRYSVFNTNGFESGLYSWENDLINSFSVPVLYGTGSHSYVMGSWKIFSKAELRIKYGFTSTYVINSRMKNVNELKLQIRINL
jgi:hypothetical protein